MKYVNIETGVVLEPAADEAAALLAADPRYAIADEKKPAKEKRKKGE